MWRFGVLNINQTSGTVVAGETQALAAAIDSAMLAQARLCASIIETANESKLPVVATQKLLQSLSANMSGLVASRSEFATAVRELNVIQARSNLKEMAMGCPNGIRPIKGFSDSHVLSAPSLDTTS
jgi:hypothetical protein